MKTNTMLAFLVIVAFLTFIYACEPPAYIVDPEVEQQKLEQKLDSLNAAVISQEWEKADTMVAADWMAYSMGEPMTWEEQKQMFEQHLSNHRNTLSNATFHVSGDGSMAWGTAQEKASFMYEGKQIEESALFTMIWEKQNGVWKMVHLNRSVKPQPQQESTMMEQDNMKSEMENE